MAGFGRSYFESFIRPTAKTLKNFLEEVKTMCGIQTRWKQAFYDEVEPIKIKDPLAVFSGAIGEGDEFIYEFTDAIKLTGHASLEVAGAYKITQKALRALYPDETPIRGEISVRVLGNVDDALNGPVSQVISLITGAVPGSGFAGLGNRFARKDTLIFDGKNQEPNAFIFTRDDNKKSVKITYHPENIPPKDTLADLFTKCILDTASLKQKEEFIRLWQGRVKTVLFEEVKNLFTVEKLN